MLGFSFGVDDKQLIKQLEQLGPKCKPLLRKAIRPLVSEVRKAVKPLIPKRTGALRKSIAVVPIKSRKFYTVGFRVFPRYVKDADGKERFYAFAPEYGVQNGTGKQEAKAFLKKGAAIAEKKMPECKAAIAAALAKAFEGK